MVSIFFIPLEYWATYLGVGLTLAQLNRTEGVVSSSQGNRFASGAGIVACIALYQYKKR